MTVHQVYTYSASKSDMTNIIFLRPKASSLTILSMFKEFLKKKIIIINSILPNSWKKKKKIWKSNKTKIRWNFLSKTLWALDQESPFNEDMPALMISSTSRRLVAMTVLDGEIMWNRKKIYILQDKPKQVSVITHIWLETFNFLLFT